MVSVVIDVLLVLWLVVFGAMAVLPLLGGGRAPQHAAERDGGALRIILPAIAGRLHPDHAASEFAEAHDPERRRAA